MLAIVTKDDKMRRKVRYTEGRLEVPPAEAMKEYVITPMLEYEKMTFQQYLLTDFAHTVMLAEEGIISRDDAAAILSCLRELEHLGVEKLPIDAEQGSLLLQVEAFMSNRIGEAAGKMHTGRSRNDQGAAIARLYTRDKVLSIIERLLALQRAIVNLADKHVETVMPGYTHLQHAQPITFAHYLLSNFYPFERDFERLRCGFNHTNMNSLGGAAIAGTCWPLNRCRTAELTGCDGIVLNSKDSIGFAPDYLAEIICDCALLMSDLGHLVGDLYVWSSYEFRMVEIDDSYADTSSIMPQKKNFDSGEKIMGEVGLSLGWPTAALGALRMTTSTDCTTAYADQLGIVDVLKKTENMLTLSVGILESLKVNQDIMIERAGAFWSTASNLADTIVRETGYSFRTAHQIVGRLVKTAIEQRKKPLEITGDMVDKAAEEIIGRRLALGDDKVRRAIDPVEFVNSRVTTGSPNPNEVRAMLKDARDELNHEREWLVARREKLVSTKNKLTAATDALLVDWKQVRRE